MLFSQQSAVGMFSSCVLLPQSSCTCCCTVHRCISHARPVVAPVCTNSLTETVDFDVA